MTILSSHHRHWATIYIRVRLADLEADWSNERSPIKQTTGVHHWRFPWRNSSISAILLADIRTWTADQLGILLHMNDKIGTKLQGAKTPKTPSDLKQKCAPLFVQRHGDPNGEANFLKKLKLEKNLNKFKFVRFIFLALRKFENKFYYFLSFNLM